MHRPGPKQAIHNRWQKRQADNMMVSAAHSAGGKAGLNNSAPGRARRVDAAIAAAGWYWVLPDSESARDRIGGGGFSSGAASAITITQMVYDGPERDAPAACPTGFKMAARILTSWLASIRRRVHVGVTGLVSMLANGPTRQSCAPWARVLAPAIALCRARPCRCRRDPAKSRCEF